MSTPRLPRAAVASPETPVDPRLREGVDRFNARQFFECHEILEQLWLQTAGRSKHFYQGLIQAAVAFHHWSKGNPAGALTLARSATGYLKRYTPAYLGLDVEAFLQRFGDVFQWLRRHPMRYDPRLVPVLRWTPMARQQ
ncbi:MAG: hypothetical protein A3I71_05215 [Omnitrophica WOR_2 bacterium RIFCSPLOWO2_02_FULL_63_16]|nr:MAG: hypothetical protein A2Z92_02465 [Omnitrophica WOR_2 bacterium GWA2_63_20]OGX18244.1 MAG: hypothetical protein A2105_05220 [Omnitrophica WOR_2 bacterium GWF2_63_9]OGX32222.1 MAG: hypothetical protein A3E56_01875 [Omnitrophica WOR_2 bacterium RIFCSPHIGHO2_12_FULL_64_13]OGX35675.1 MAG: hypothetical protein A3B73_04470 [Omnitrophica WOR_2 bacterium RIFCSPHIGHO2_02_FULL_63_39]OGX44347.1 MAG: hypothetical protein A3I71_05215 [Omnitrophica WOR_2 bacterium RIFCSPLOWO2_02_FULL_63_16]OGX47651.1